MRYLQHELEVHQKAVDTLEEEEERALVLSLLALLVQKYKC